MLYVILNIPLVSLGTLSWLWPLPSSYWPQPTDFGGWTRQREDLGTVLALFINSQNSDVFIINTVTILVKNVKHTTVQANMKKVSSSQPDPVHRNAISNIYWKNTDKLLDKKYIGSWLLSCGIDKRLSYNWFFLSMDTDSDLHLVKLLVFIIFLEIFEPLSEITELA